MTAEQLRQRAAELRRLAEHLKVTRGEPEEIAGLLADAHALERQADAEEAKS
jgi:hypothetical protein